jgi:hypothetical protein
LNSANKASKPAANPSATACSECLPKPAAKGPDIGDGVIFTDEEILKLRDYFKHGVPVSAEEGMALCDQLLAERAWYRASERDSPQLRGQI